VVAAACGGADPARIAGARSSRAATSAGPLTLSLAPAGPLTQGTFTAYAASVTNTTADAISSVNLVADFPDTTMNQIPAGCVRAPGGQPEFICPIASIPAGATLTFATQVRPNLAGTLTFAAFCGGNGLTVNVVTDVENVAPAPTDVQVTGFGSTGSPPVGSAYGYTFQVKNNGPFPTSGGVSFTDVLPASLSFLGVTTSVGACVGGETVSCDLGDLAVGAQAIVQISVQAPPAAQTIVDSASVSLGAQTDRNPANDAASVTVTTR
jgi:uncharacterized repeat protein (TIGR01451 family)